MIRCRFFLSVAAAFLGGLLLAPPARAQIEIGPTLAQVLKREQLVCGVTESPGFAQKDGAGVWRGFEADLCRAVASAVLDDPSKAHFVALLPKERVGALQNGQIDLLVSASPWTQSRDAGQKVIYVAVAFYDGQGFLVRRQRGFASAQDLDGASICVEQGTPSELEAADFFRTRKAKYELKLFPALEDAAKAYDQNKCDALTADVSTLNGLRVGLAAPADHVVLPDYLTKAPRGPLVRQGDDHWLNIVRWTLFAMLDAEELDVSKESVDAALNSENPHIRRLLGVDGALGDDLGLPHAWAYRIVKEVGNYADVFERNLGQGAPFAMERRLNALWTKGGLMYAPPVR
ncbi:amino acid ABC transporter substrate-binding protein [Methylocystis sp. 9N]|uniref:Amino acid ABC transporter substrate-binding protein n=1 Tax=Methylocystis borbori TaxID=3118750 RepID=A0ABU7XDT5_9HYPH